MRHLGECAIERIGRDVVGDRDVRVVVELGRAGERTCAHGALEPLAIADSGRQGDEDNGRHRTEAAGAAKVDAERPLLGSDRFKMRLDRGQLDVVENRRRDQGDVRRNRQRKRIAEPFAPEREFGAERLGQADRHADGVLGITGHWLRPLPARIQRGREPAPWCHRHLTGTLRALGQDHIELGRVVDVPADPLPHRRHELEHSLGKIAFEITVALAA